jgi:SAM-dependent methyltransferase
MKISESEPWQLQMFHRSLKKRWKLRTLLDFAGELDQEQCLFVTCGENNGALNYYFRAHGGCWTWADVAGENLEEMSDLLGEPVHHVPDSVFPFAGGQFDCVIASDVLEHVVDDHAFLREIYRVLRPGARAVVTVPNGDARLLANRIKWRAGMTEAKYGHVRAGYTLDELTFCLKQAGFQPEGRGGYSRFFTEMMELMINFGYVHVLSRKRKRADVVHIVPTTSADLKRHAGAFRLYSLVYPLMRLVAGLDAFLPASNNNAVIVSAVRGPVRSDGESRSVAADAATANQYMESAASSSRKLLWPVHPDR